MTTWVCTADGVAYAVGMAGCPRCGSTEYREDGTGMPKITRHGGPSVAPRAAAPAGPDSVPAADEKPAPAPAPAKAEPAKPAKKTTAPHRGRS